VTAYKLDHQAIELVGPGSAVVSIVRRPSSLHSAVDSKAAVFHA